MLQRRLLTDNDVDRIAEAVVAILDRTGVVCQNAELLEALAGRGARIDPDRETATFPPKVTQEFVEALRREGGGGDAADAGPILAPGPPGVGTQIAQFFLDYGKGERRPGNRADLIYLTKLGDALHGEQGVGHSLLLTDVAPMLEPLEAALVLAEYARKPTGAFAWNVRQVDYLIEMGEILGIPNWFCWGATCFAHPLRFDKVVADCFVRRVREGAPTGLTSMAVAGATAPVTVAGYVAVAAAEIVVTWLAARAINETVPLAGDIWAGTVDMATGTVSYSCPDALSRGFGVVEFLRRWCGRHLSASMGEYADAKTPGFYAAMEKANKAMTIAAFTGRLAGLGQGMIESGKTICPVQLLLERELAGGLAHLARPVRVDAETLALETIVDVGSGLDKSHVETDHTLAHFRESLWLPKLLDRSGWDGPEWEHEVLTKLQDRADALVASYRKPDVDPDELAKMRVVVERARAELQ